MSAPILQFKRGTFSNLNFGLRAGEPALTSDTFDLFVGINSTFEDNKFFGSHRYWEREDGDTALRLRLVDKTGNVANSIHIKSPDAHTGVTTYTFPSTPEAGEFLQVDANGTLSWASNFDEIDVNELFAGDATFGGNVAFTTTTASTDPTTGGVVVTAGLGVGGNVNIGGNLGVTGIGTFGGAVTIYDDTQSTDKDTGSLILEGGLGVEKNVNIGGNLNVTGISTFVGSVTFKGGTINLGDENTDNINVAGEFISNLTPNDDDTYDIGIGTQRWRNTVFSGVGTFATSVRTPLLNSSNTTLQAPTIGNYAGERVRLYDFDDPTNTNYAIGVETSHIWFGVDNYGDGQGFKWYGEETQVARLGGTGNLTLEGNLRVNGTGISTFAGLIDGNGGLDITGQTTLNNGLSVTGVSTFTGILNSSSLIAATNLTASGISTFNTLDVIENTTLGTGTGDTFTVEATSTFNGPATFLGTLTGTISTATRATLVDTTETATAAEFYPTFVSASASTQSQTVRTDGGISYNPDSNTLTVPNIKTENLKHSNGTQSIAIDASGNVGLSSNLTVAGNLFVNGSTTSVNTNTLKVKDSLIDIGKIDDGSGNLVPPIADLNIDIGVLFNYYDTEARKAAVYWDDSEGRIAVASRVTEAASVLTAQAYAALEVGGLWVNNACTGGAAEIISCFGGDELEVRNVLIDAGTF